MVRKRMNYYRRGSQAERDAVNRHLANGALFAARFAGSKVGKGSVIKADVIAIYDDPYTDYTPRGYGTIVLEQHKKGKTKNTKEKKEFYSVRLPEKLEIIRKFVEVE